MQWTVTMFAVHRARIRLPIQSRKEEKRKGEFQFFRRKLCNTMMEMVCPMRRIAWVETSLRFQSSAPFTRRPLILLVVIK